MDYSSCSTWYIQNFRQGLPCWSSSQIKSYEISSQMFGLILCFLSNRWFSVFLDGKSSQEYSINAGVPQGLIIDPTLFLLCINHLLDDVICKIEICSVHATLYSECYQSSDLLLNLNLIYKTLWTWAGNSLLILMLKKLNLFSLTGFITLVLLM